jgi:hypothetical protein
MERFEAWLIERPDSWIASSRSSLLCPLAKYLQEKIGIEVKANKSGFRYFPKDSSESVVVELPVWAPGGAQERCNDQASACGVKIDGWEV